MLTSGKIDWSCSDKFLYSIFGSDLLGVIAIVLFFSSVICVIGLAKLPIVGFEGSGAIFGRLFLNGGKLSGRFPSENKKLVSCGSVGSRKCGGGGGKSSSSKFGGGEKSSKSLLYDLRGGV